MAVPPEVQDGLEAWRKWTGLTRLINEIDRDRGYQVPQPPVQAAAPKPPKLTKRIVRDEKGDIIGIADEGD